MSEDGKKIKTDEILKTNNEDFIKVNSYVFRA